MVAKVAPLAADFLDGSADTRRALRASIKMRWTKFTDFELGALAGNGDLINQVAIKYGLKLARAKGDVADFLRGRKI